MTKLLSLGSDPEYFLSDLQGNVRSSIGLIGGDKDHPLKLSYCSILEDNVAVEINPEPAFNQSDFVKNTINAMADMNNLLKRLDLKPIEFSAIEFSPLELLDPMSRISGCIPDFNAYTEQANQAVDMWSTNLRSAAGHIHVGVKLDEEDKPNLVKVLDIMVSLPLAFKFRNSNDEVLRRSLYGKAGCFRFKPYGLEYRTPSNKWTFNPKLIAWVWSQVERSVDEMDSLLSYHGSIKDKLVSSINNQVDEEFFYNVVNDLNLEVI